MMEFAFFGFSIFDDEASKGIREHHLFAYLFLSVRINVNNKEPLKIGMLNEAKKEQFFLS